MNKNIFIVIISIVVVFVAVLLFSLSFSEETTELDTKFFNATVSGVLVEDNSSEYLSAWKLTYNDTKNNIYYDFLMADSLNYIKGSCINLLGVEKVDTVEYNGVHWEIYYFHNSYVSMEYKSYVGLTGSCPGYLCFASEKEGDYLIAVSSGAVHSNSSKNTKLFKEYLEPLLNNITLKDSQNPPKEYQLVNSTKENYDIVNNYIRQYGWDDFKDKLKYSM